MDEYLNFAKVLAHEAGAVMLKYFNTELEHKIKQDKTIVTIADEEINSLVIKKVGEKFPEHSVLGEEESNSNTHECAWVCDPIDGTNPFARGLPVSTFSLALVKSGRPVLGVICDPFTNSLYYAAKGEGAYLNDKKISVSLKKLQRNTIINVDWWPEAEIDTWTAMNRLSKQTGVYTLSIGSVVRAASLVASGKIEAAVFPGTAGKFMDIAAAKVIVEEAGGKVTNLFGEEQRYDRDIKGAIISNAVCHQEIIGAIKGLA